MHFCSECGNMLYLRLADPTPIVPPVAGETANPEQSVSTGTAQQDLVYYCRNCGHTDDTLTIDNVCVVDSGSSKSAKLSNVVNRYTKLDPTLPHTKTIRCPNSGCGSNEDESKRDVIYIRYDDRAMKYVYICAVCDTMWTTSQQG